MPEEIISFTMPGPSPWYLRGSLASFEASEVHLYKWEDYDSPTISGLSRLISPNGDTTLLVDYYCYVLQPLPNNRILIWYQIGHGKKSTNELPCLKFILLCVSKLAALHDLDTKCKMLKEANERIHFDEGEPATFHFPTNVREGMHHINIPAQFKDLPEQLVLGRIY